MYALRLLQSQPLRLTLTIGGVALCIVLMLFLLATYRGVADGSIEYIRGNPVDLWVLQRNATNILRGSSILSTAHGDVIRQVSGVRSVDPVLLILATIKKDAVSATVFLAGFDQHTQIGGPPEIINGRTVKDDDEIVLDKSFAARSHLHVGDNIAIHEDTLCVVGLSAKTNALVIQYGFVSLRRAQSLIGFPNIATCFLITTERPELVSSVARGIREELPGIEVYDHETFLHNNIREMESGFLPLLYTIAAIGAVVLTAILSLLLSISILERRKDFAVMKAIGSPPRFLRGKVMQLALLISSASVVAATALIFPLTAFIEKLTPEVTTKSTPVHFAAVLAVVGLMSLCSSFIAMHRLARIYPVEAFACTP